jgi:hypothetical protein
MEPVRYRNSFVEFVNFDIEVAFGRASRTCGRLERLKCLANHPGARQLALGRRPGCPTGLTGHMATRTPHLSNWDVRSMQHVGRASRTCGRLRRVKCFANHPGARQLALGRRPRCSTGLTGHMATRTPHLSNWDVCSMQHIGRASRTCGRLERLKCLANHPGARQLAPGRRPGCPTELTGHVATQAARNKFAQLGCVLHTVHWASLAHL